MPLRFSLIVCTRERPLLLARLLRGIRLLRYPVFELILVCDPQDGQTTRCIAELAGQARLGHCGPANLAMARNIGLALAQGEIAAFIDDDAVPEPDWLDRLASAYADPGVAAAGGFIRGKDGVAFQSRYVLIDPFGADHHRRNLPKTLKPGWFPGLTGTNFSVRLAEARAIGGFDEQFAYFLEETDFLRRLARAGGRIDFAEAAEVHHGYAESERRRTGGAPRSFLQIARSKAYFCLVDRQAQGGDPAIEAALRRFERGKMRLLATQLLLGRLRLADAARLRRELKIGLEAGRLLAESGRRLADFAARESPAFQPFLPPSRPASRRLCVLARHLPENNAATNRIGQAVARGQEVTAILSGGGRRQVAFRDGVWLHRLSLLHRLPFLARLGFDAELRRISPRRGFDSVETCHSFENSGEASSFCERKEAKKL